MRQDQAWVDEHHLERLDDKLVETLERVDILPPHTHWIRCPFVGPGTHDLNIWCTRNESIGSLTRQFPWPAGKRGMDALRVQLLRSSGFSGVIHLATWIRGDCASRGLVSPRERPFSAGSWAFASYLRHS